jgi:hypothetical protein
VTRSHYLLAWGYALVCALLVRRALTPAHAASGRTVSATSAATVSSEVNWFRRVKPYCNTLEVLILSQSEPAPPATVAGAGYHAACFALAGRIDDARRIIDRLAPRDRYKAVAIVFDVAHPVADAGDDRSAGPIMEMVVDYWPNHYMALYHAGMAEYMLGQRDLSRHNLQEFLKYYHERDGWTSNAVEVLKRLNDPAAIPKQRPPEPRG